jgi:hypothetical protein
MAREKQNQRVQVAMTALQLSVKGRDDGKPLNVLKQAKAVVANPAKRRRNKTTSGKNPATIADAMSFLDYKEKGLWTLYISMTGAVDRFISQGKFRYDQTISKKDDLLNFATATHFMGNAHLTEACLGKWRLNLERHSQRAFNIDVRWGLFDNNDRGNGVFEMYKDREVSIFSGGEKKYHESNELPKIFTFNGDLKTGFRYLSLVFPKHSQDFESKIESYIKSSHTDLTVASSNSAVKEVVKKILNNTSEQTQIKFQHADVRPFATMHYVTKICQLKASFEFSLNQTKHTVLITRKMVLSSFKDQHMTESEVQYNIPLCEEFSLQLKSTNLKGEVYAPKVLYVVAKPRTAQYTFGAGSAEASSQLHFLGDNAFTVNMPQHINLPIENHAAAMYITGWLVGQLQAVKCSNKPRLNAAKHFFASLFGVKTEDRKNLDDETKSPLSNDSAVAKHAKLRINTRYNKQGVPESDRKFQDIDILKSSFLANQNAGSLTQIEGGMYFLTKQWFVSKTFSVVVLSPAQFPLLNYVFVWTTDTSMEPSSGNNVNPTCEVMDYTKAAAPQTDGDAYKIGGGDLPEEISQEIAKPANALRLKRSAGRRDVLANGGPYDTSPGRPPRMNSQFRPPKFASSLPPELELELELL